VVLRHISSHFQWNSKWVMEPLGLAARLQQPAARRQLAAATAGRAWAAAEGPPRAALPPVGPLTLEQAAVQRLVAGRPRQCRRR
jgi:hypothetical protein